MEQVPRKQCHLTFVHRPDAAIENLVLATVLAAKHYDVHVHTTPELSLKLSDVGLKATYWTRTWTDHKPWSRHKLDTYQAVCCGGGFNFLHIDDDVFLFDPLPEGLLVQNLESPEGYQWSRRLPQEWRDKYGAHAGYNMGVFSMDAGLVDNYVHFAYRALRDAPHPLPPNVEQLTLARFLLEENLTPGTLAKLDFQDAPPRDVYWHLMWEKRKPEVRARVRALLREHAPWFPVPDEEPVAVPVFVPSTPVVTASTVRDFYRRKKPATRRRPWSVLPSKDVTLMFEPPGLGDTVMLTDLERAAHAEGKVAYVAPNRTFFWDLMRYCPSHRNKQTPVRVCLVEAVNQSGVGPGHMIQRARRLFGLKIDAVPRGHLVVPGVKRIPGRVCLHTSAGQHATWQREHLHPRGRTLYPDTVAALLRLANRKDLTFVEVGAKRTLHHPRIEDGTGTDVAGLLRLMAECEFHIGILSGPSHVAAALGLKLVSIINFPDPQELMLPNLLDTGTVEEEWLYPQQVVLHQDADAAWMPRFNLKTLEAALGGDVYPYWRTDVAEELIREA